MFYQNSYQFNVDSSEQDVCIVRYSNPRTPGTEGAFPLHSHNFYELDYCYDNMVVHEIANQAYEVPAQSLVFLPPMCNHSVHHDTRTSHMVIQFSPRLLQKCMPGFTENHMLTAGETFARNGYLSLTDPKNEKIFHLVKEIVSLHPWINIKEYRERFTPADHTPAELMYETGLLLMLLSELLKQNHLQSTIVNRSSTSVSHIQKLVKHLIEHPEEKLTMKEAAAMVNMGDSNFCRTFKSTTGYAYIDFCNMQRIAHSKELLKSTDLSVTEISMRLNFGSISYFNRIFKKFTGTSPLVYRASQR